jgi:23S rRNA (cytosine1962-C5)-methyltransferase
MAHPRFSVHKRAARRILDGHPWVFGNELDTPARELPPGGTVDIAGPDGRVLGKGYANPNSLIAVRLCSRSKTQHIDLPGFWAARLREALELRTALLPGATAYRLVNGESDGMPGLVLDRLGDVVVAQVSTLGMEQRLPLVLEALPDVLPLSGGLLRNDTRLRDLEGLAQGVEVWFGEVPDTVEIDEDGVRFAVAPRTGEGTGHSFDQRMNRRFAASLCAGRTVLDVYAGTGAWGLHALVAGAEHVHFVDKSGPASAAIAHNAELNGVEAKVDIVNDEARRTLMAMVSQGARYDAVVLDPPPFAKTKKAAGSGLKGYQEINALAMQLVQPGGFVFTSSCSHHVFEDRFLTAINEAAQETGKRLKLIRRGEQAPDHPILPAMPETRTLKSFAFQVLQQI